MRPTNEEFFIGQHLVNNWTFGLNGRLESAKPYPISTGDGPFSGSTFFGAGNETVQPPNVLADGTLSTTNIAGCGQSQIKFFRILLSQIEATYQQAGCLPHHSNRN